MFDAHDIRAVIHFAGLKAVGESVSRPLYYYQNNIAGTLTLCDVMAEHGVYDMVFSSSATVYGKPEKLPITEDALLTATSPYGQTKLMMEQILTDLQHSDPSFNIALLRCCNPVGAHQSGRSGEDPQGVPNNLLTYVSQVAAGQREQIQVYGSDYATPDGTGVRD